MNIQTEYFKKNPSFVKEVKIDTFIEEDMQGNTYQYNLYNYKNCQILKRMSDGKINLSHLAKTIDPTIKTIKPFTDSMEFYNQLMIFDDELEKAGNIYLLRYPTYIKIGRTFNIDKRYSEWEERQYLTELISVKNDVKAENAVLNALNKSKIKIHHGREYFKCENANEYRRIVSIFRNALKKYKTTHHSSPLIDNSCVKKSGITRGLYGTSEIATIIINKYATDKKDYLHLNGAATIDNNNRKIDILLDPYTNQEFWYVKLGDYTTLRWFNKSYYNIDKLIREINKKLHKRFEVKKWLDSAEFKELEEFYNSMRKNNEPIIMEYKNNVNGHKKVSQYLSGRYIHAQVVTELIRHFDKQFRWDMDALERDIIQKIHVGSNAHKLDSDFDTLQ